MAHTASCANAVGDTCRCAGCGGSLHGWPGHLALANRPPRERLERRAEAGRDWYAAVGTDEPTRRANLASPTPDMLGRAVGAARVDIAGCLAARPGTAARIEELGGLIRTRAFERVAAEAGRRSRERPDLVRVAEVLPGYFWCALLSALVAAADRLDRAVDTVPGEARELLTQGPPQDWGPARDLVADTALEAVWECAAVFLLGWRPGELLLVMRILAVFLCPNPGRHPEVARLCLLPLGRGVLQDATALMLRQSLPPQ